MARCAAPCGAVPHGTTPTIRSPFAIHLPLSQTIEHFDCQLPLLLSKTVTVESRLHDGDAHAQADQMAFLQTMDESWEALEHAVDVANEEVLVSEREHRSPREVG